MEMEIALEESVAHVKLRGRLDANGVDGIETKFTASVVPGGKNTVVDLSDVSFVSSMGLRMLISLSKALKRRNAKIVLFGPQRQPNEVFTSAQLGSIISIVRNESEARAMLST